MSEFDSQSGSNLSPDELLGRLGELEREVAASREIQAALAMSEERYALAVEGTTEGIWDWEVGTDLVYYADRFKELLGYEPDEFQHDLNEFESRLHPEDQERFRDAMRAHLRDDVPYDVEYRLKCKDDTYRWFRARGQAFRDETGVATRMAGGITDITERMASRRELVQATQKAEGAIAELGAFFQLSLDLLCIAGTDGYYKKINPSFQSTLGYSEEDLLGNPFLVFVHPDDQEKTVEAVQVLGKGKEVTHFQNRYRHKDGHFLWFEWSAASSPDHETIYAMARDVTQRRQEEVELREAKVAAESANRAKSEFLANMSHEIRTPMNSIIGMSELLLGTELNSEQLEYQNLILTSAESLLSILNDILDFSKIEAGKLDLQPSEFDLRAEVDETLRVFEVRAVNKGLQLSQRVAIGVPRRVKTDLGRLRQVLVNLVGNAIKFTPAGSVEVELGLETLEGSEACLRFGVKDTGVGIPADKLDEVFEPFTQAEGSTARQFEGTGLGLSICRKIVELMGGEIWVESEEGDGCLFHFTVRCEVVADEVQPVPVRAAALETKPADVPTMKVLLVEDGRANQLVATRFLQRRGHLVKVAVNGSEAVRMWEEDSYDAILMDIHMPEMNGFEATRLIREKGEALGRHTPIIAMTANAMQGDREACLAEGMDDYLPKPVRAAELYEVLERFAPKA